MALKVALTILLSIGVVYVELAVVCLAVGWSRSRSVGARVPYPRRNPLRARLADYHKVSASAARLRHVSWAFLLAAALVVSASSCSLFQPAAAQPVTPPAPTPAQVASATIKCMTNATLPCLAQSGAGGSPQLCMAMAALNCGSVN
jgi:hypothetical protein